MTIGYLDIAILVVLLLGIVRGAMIGLVRQTTNLVGLVLTVILAIALTRPVGQLVQSYTDWPHEASLVVSFLGIFLVVKLATILVAKSADGAVDALHLSTVNRAAGGFFGAFKAALLLSTVLLVLKMADIPDKATTDESVFHGPVAGLLPQTWDYLSGKAPILNEYKQKIEDEARDSVGKMGGDKLGESGTAPDTN